MNERNGVEVAAEGQSSGGMGMMSGGLLPIPFFHGTWCTIPDSRKKREDPRIE